MPPETNTRKRKRDETDFILNQIDAPIRRYDDIQSEEQHANPSQEESSKDEDRILSKPSEKTISERNNTLSAARALLRISNSRSEADSGATSSDPAETDHTSEVFSQTSNLKTAGDGVAAAQATLESDNHIANTSHDQDHKGAQSGNEDKRRAVSDEVAAVGESSSISDGVSLVEERSDCNNAKSSELVKTCPSCRKSEPAVEFCHGRLTERCKHKAVDRCKSCISAFMEFIVFDKGFKNIFCPFVDNDYSCGARFNDDEVKKFGSATTYERYLRLKAKQTFQGGEASYSDNDSSDYDSDSAGSVESSPEYSLGLENIDFFAGSDSESESLDSEDGESLSGFTLQHSDLSGAEDTEDVGEEILVQHSKDQDTHNDPETNIESATAAESQGTAAVSTTATVDTPAPQRIRYRDPSTWPRSSYPPGYPPPYWREDGRVFYVSWPSFEGLTFYEAAHAVYRPESAPRPPNP
ncbi:hypothetical protein ONS95_001162 [Cadophora gregata]|uniref:uncharacterized protein n=1 Tax=Cadophora gregata TaxID=51156 RepID=UPI0026DBC5A3|nr:uncharacterized protein ONS95_001162 [Cadophora gregata]KAK0129227.1 hypothetical protein ONS95_001162 [Cadophora gregata]